VAHPARTVITPAPSGFLDELVRCHGKDFVEYYGKFLRPFDRSLDRFAQGESARGPICQKEKQART
jgi:hypothetical protein